MPEIIAVCVCGTVMAALYKRTDKPKLYAFFNAAAGALSLVAEELVFVGDLNGVTPYNAALSVILGVPGTIAHRFLEML